MQTLAHFIATCGYLGYVPYAPGTVASAVAGYMFFFVPVVLLPVALFGGLCLVAIAIWASHITVKMLRDNDPACVVIDEVVGMYVACAFLPKVWWVYLVTFLLFRLFDILKPFPIHKFEQIAYCSLGVVFDDVVAGILAHLGVWGLLLLV